jgi:putative hydrolase of the HAD superfamily
MSVGTIRVVLFDVGGVLVETSGVGTMLAWMGHRISAEDLWKMWLTSPVVRAFETGRMSNDEFADQVIADFGLPVRREEFLREMATWSATFLPGAVELVERIPVRFVRATLCNSNPIHWPHLMQNDRFSNAFLYHFASHLTGKIKPDEAAFRHVIENLRCDPQEVLFLDDNELNVIGANAVGMKAMRVRGVAEARRALINLNVIAD